MPGPIFHPNQPIPGIAPNPLFGSPVLHPNAPPRIGPDNAKLVERSDTVNAIYGFSKSYVGVIGESGGDTGVEGRCETGDGVYGTGVRGVVGESRKFQGVYGTSTENAGVVGESHQFVGVYGVGHVPDHAGVFGINDRGGPGIEGSSERGLGAWGHSETGDGILGTSAEGVGIRARGGSLAAMFEGDVEVTGNLRFTNADCAEEFDVHGEGSVEPGTVMVLDDEGSICQSQYPYDKRVAGVISGAGTYKPGIVLDRRETELKRQPLALLGKVFCKVDAQYAPVEVGDLLTTSATAGHAMKAGEPMRAFGAVIGKALLPLKEGRGLIPILVSLQ
jgi:hypothetical protein